jgi:hypothetical protein
MADASSSSPDEVALEAALREARERVAWLEATSAARREAFMHGQRTLDQLRKRRHRGDVPMWEGAQRAAFRTLVLAVGCVLVISGAATLDATAGGVAIVASFAVLLVEALR